MGYLYPSRVFLIFINYSVETQCVYVKFPLHPINAESERWVQKALNKLMKNRTTLIIAQRLATVVHADRIIVMENGRMIAEGSHQQLLISSPKYQTLAALQFGHQDK